MREDARISQGGIRKRGFALRLFPAKCEIAAREHASAIVFLALNYFAKNLYFFFCFRRIFFLYQYNLKIEFSRLNFPSPKNFSKSIFFSSLFADNVI